MSAGSPLLVPITDISNCLPILISDSDKVTLLIKGIGFDKVGRELYTRGEKYSERKK